MTVGNFSTKKFHFLKSMRNLRITSQVNHFRNNNMFFDVELRHKGESIKAHRLILSQNSQWFREKLNNVKPPSYNEPVVIDLPWNEDNAFQHVLEAIYTGHLQLTPDIAPAVLKVADFYKFRNIAYLTSDYIKDLVKTYNNEKKDIKAEYCKKFVSYQLPEYYDILVDYAARKFKQLFIAEDQNETVDEVYKMCADGRFIAKIFMHQDTESTKGRDPSSGTLYYDIKSLFKDDDDVICEQFDAFFKNHRTNMTLEEKKALSDVKIINWTKQEKYQLIIRHTCNWLDPSISRNLYGIVLSNRRQVCKHFDGDIQRIQEETVNRWYGAEWLSQITSAIDSKTTPEINVVKFMTTLGGAVDYVDPELYGFINPESPNSKNSPEEIFQERQPKNAFRDNTICFTALQCILGDFKQYQFHVDFGPKAIFEAHSILVDMKNRYRNLEVTDNQSCIVDPERRKSHKLPPKVYVQSCPDNKTEAFVPDDIGVNWQKFKHTLNKFVVTVDKDEPTIFLRYVDIKGCFLPTIQLPKK